MPNLEDIRAFAEVVLQAESDTREELEVVRRIERGAGSAYRINGKDARAKDVALVFADAATGAHSLDSHPPLRCPHGVCADRARAARRHGEPDRQRIQL